MTESPIPCYKQELRRQARRMRAGLDPWWRARATIEAARHALRLVDHRAPRTVAVFSGFGSEIDTSFLIEELLARRLRVLLPLTLTAQRRIELRPIQSFPSDCLPGTYGILEPNPMLNPEIVAGDEVDLMFVPGLLFTLEGWRLGYGGGYYDRLLREERPGLAVGFGFSMQLAESLPREDWDRPVDMLVTEKGEHMLPAPARQRLDKPLAPPAL